MKNFCSQAFSLTLCEQSRFGALSCVCDALGVHLRALRVFDFRVFDQNLVKFSKIEISLFCFFSIMKIFEKQVKFRSAVVATFLYTFRHHETFEVQFKICKPIF